MKTYKVFSRKSWVGDKKTGFKPAPGGRRITIRTGLSLDEARELCASGPANQARAAGKEYRHLSFYEFEEE